MLARTDDIAAAVEAWLAQFERALADADEAALRTLFHRDSHWRDVLALTWRIKTVEGLDPIVRELQSGAGWAHASGFQTDAKRTPPRRVVRAGTEAIEAIFKFE